MSTLQFWWFRIGGSLPKPLHPGKLLLHFAPKNGGLEDELPFQLGDV